MTRFRSALSILVMGGAFALVTPALGQSASPADGMSMPARDPAPAAAPADMKPDMKMMGMKAAGEDEKPMMMMMDECMKMHADIVALRAEIAALRAELKGRHMATRRRHARVPQPPVPPKAPPAEHRHTH
jgi:hypothetical protein